jgi:hypothetical protein
MRRCAPLDTGIRRYDGLPSRKTMAHIHFIGGEKGGVKKSLVA